LTRIECNLLPFPIVLVKEPFFLNLLGACSVKDTTNYHIIYETNSHLRSVIKSLSCALIVLGAAAQAADKTDPAGTWTWTQPGRNGGADRTNTLTLKMEDSKLTGKISAPGRGGQAAETAIADAKVEGDAISFVVVREYNGNSMTNKYAGKISADKITGKIESVRNGEARSNDWEAKRMDAKK